MSGRSGAGGPRRSGAAAKQRSPRWGEQVEGRQAVRELLRARRRRVLELFVAMGPAAGPLAEIMDEASDLSIALRRVEEHHLASMALTKAPQGVLARAEPLEPTPLEELARSGQAGLPALVVVLDRVSDPQNLGAVLRSAHGSGATGLVFGRHRAAGLTPAAMKAAAGAAEHVPVAEVASVAAAVSSLAGLGMWTVALDAQAEQSIWDLEVASEPLALVLGAEGRGVSDLAGRRCEVAVRIPLEGVLASLNVSAAAAVACFEVARRRRRGSIH